MSFVLDASVAASWFIRDEFQADTDDLLTLATETGCVVPVIWPVEVANVLWQAIRRKRMVEKERGEAIVTLQDMRFVTDELSIFSAWSAADELVQAHGLTHYDATYLALAMRRRIPLATLDADLRKAAKKAGVKVLPRPSR